MSNQPHNVQNVTNNGTIGTMTVNITSGIPANNIDTQARGRMIRTGLTLLRGALTQMHTLDPSNLFAVLARTMVENQLKTQLDLTQEDAEALVQTIIALPRADIETFFTLILSWPDITSPTLRERKVLIDELRIRHHLLEALLARLPVLRQLVPFARNLPDISVTQFINLLLIVGAFCVFDDKVFPYTVEELMQAGDDFYNGMTNNGPGHKKGMQNVTERSDIYDSDHLRAACRRAENSPADADLEAILPVLKKELVGSGFLKEMPPDIPVKGNASLGVCVGIGDGKVAKVIHPALKAKVFNEEAPLADKLAEMFEDSDFGMPQARAMFKMLPAIIGITKTEFDTTAEKDDATVALHHFQSDRFNNLLVAYSGLERFKVTTPITFFSSEHTLVQEDLYAKSPDAVSFDKFLDDEEVPCNVKIGALEAQVILHYFQMSHGHFHSDPHGGNLYVSLAGKTLILIDHGAVQEMKAPQWDALIDIARANEKLLTYGGEEAKVAFDKATEVFCDKFGFEFEADTPLETKAIVIKPFFDTAYGTASMLCQGGLAPDTTQQMQRMRGSPSKLAVDCLRVFNQVTQRAAKALRKEMPAEAGASFETALQYVRSKGLHSTGMYVQLAELDNKPRASM